MRVWVRGLRLGERIYGTRRWDGTDKVLRIGVGSLGPGGVKVQGLNPKGEGSGFRVQSSGFRVQGSGFRVQGYREGVQKNVDWLFVLGDLQLC